MTEVSSVSALFSLYSTVGMYPICCLQRRTHQPRLHHVEAFTASQLLLRPILMFLKRDLPRNVFMLGFSDCTWRNRSPD